MDTKKHLVIVGNGMVSHRFCERLAALDSAGRFAVSVYGEEPRPAYDRVNLSAYFAGKSADDLALGTSEWYREQGFALHLGETVDSLDAENRTLRLASGNSVGYDHLVIATGSAPFVPPIPGIEKEGVFVYRTIEDLDAIRAYAKSVRSAAVIGGGLLGLEAAKAVRELGLETHVVEFASRLMPRQLNDPGSGILASKIREMGVEVLLDRQTESVCGNGRVTGLRFKNESPLDVDMIVVSAGIRPRDELGKAAGLEIAPRGGIAVDDQLRSSDPDISVIGEAAAHKGLVYGLVAPGYEMAEALASTLTGTPKTFEGADLSTKLKLLGVDVASFGDPFVSNEDTRTIEVRNDVDGVYKCIVLDTHKSLLVGGTLVGDTDQYAQLLHLFKSGEALPESPEELIMGSRNGNGDVDLGDEVQICSCNNVTRGAISSAVQSEGISALGPLKECTSAGTGCGGCLPLVTRILESELKKLGRGGKRRICVHFDLTRQELFQVVKVRRYESFSEVLKHHGTGNGCEVCKPVVASILASLWNEFIGNRRHETLQDTNDRFLANIQRRGSYSVVPRVPAGEITPEKLIALGSIAKKFGLYTKITGGQRIDMFGARVDQLPTIWAELVDAGFESGHAYGKAVRTVKSCVGTTWCRYGVQDAVGFAITVEERYKGIRAPHKIKMAVSGCVRECAEARCKDIGLIATEQGWNLFVCGNGGARPRHADLFATDLDDESALRYIDRVLMYYIHTADHLTRTATWLENLEGGLGHLRDVVIEDALGICEQLDEDMARLVNMYSCEWAEVVADPKKQKRFRHFSNADKPDPNLVFVSQRDQSHPADWPAPGAAVAAPSSGTAEATWVAAGKVADFPFDGGMAIAWGDTQIAVFNFASRGTWYATENRCPHMGDMALARGILGDDCGTPKVACPLHKKTFSLEDGQCASGDKLAVRTFPVEVREGEVYVMLPPAEAFARSEPQVIGTSIAACSA